MTGAPCSVWVGVPLGTTYSLPEGGHVSLPSVIWIDHNGIYGVAGGGCSRDDWKRGERISGFGGVVKFPGAV